jgi:hypothetical protein
MNVRLTKAAEYTQTLALPACVLALLGFSGLAGLDSSTGAPPMLNRVAPALAANAEPAIPSRAITAPATAPQALVHNISTTAALPAQDGTATNLSADIELSVPLSETTADSAPATKPDIKPDTTTLSAAVSTPAEASAPAETPAAPEPAPIVVASLPDPAQDLPPASPLVDRAPNQTSTNEASLNSVDIFDECYAADACIDRYLWALYQRTPKEDAVKMTEQSKVTVKRKGKMVTVTRTSTRVVDEDFAWKDPKAAEHVNMSMQDYVIGGMDQDFKLKLFRFLRAAEQAGFVPGITSAFRDDYRQSIASGLKAADNRSYHGGSLRGGYGHGLAADIVSVKGATRAERLASSDALWRWVDQHGPEYGIARPYLDHDPPHVAPFDGQEYANHRGSKRQNVAANKPHKGVAAPDDHSATKRPKIARSS